MESHKRILGIIYIVTGILLLMGMMIASMFLSMMLPWVLDSVSADDQWVFTWLIPFLRAVAIFVCIFIALPSLLAGWGLLNQKSWAMLLALVVGCLRLFSFPIGTAIGIYTIWVYVEDNRQKQNERPI
ncbi:MAG: hypothetical protein JNL40_10170 [Cyclobacteriaceae bacterium]|nr:hypothetical protein [Cyclobacteriaceae bacterium]